MSGRISPTIFEKGQRFPGFGPLPIPWSFNSDLGTQSNLRYADDNTLMAESEELQSLLMKAKKESEKVGLKLKIQKTKIMASSPIISWQIKGETMETVGLHNHCRW